MKLTFCGADENVTGSRHLLTVNGKNVLLDCGLVQGHRKDADAQNRTFLFDPRTIDAVVLSHAHIDHIGALPLLVLKGFRGKIHATPATIDIARYMLRDSGHIQESDASFWNRHHGEGDWIVPFYTVADAEAVDGHFEPLPYHEKREITEGCVVELLEAGHILGSAIIRADLAEGGRTHRVTYSGDLGRNVLPIIRSPERFGETDTLLLESTYGDRLHDDFKDGNDEMAAAITDAVKRRGKVIIPAFALERTQEIVYILHKLFHAGKIPEVPVYVDSPLASNLLQVFLEHSDDFDEETRTLFFERHDNPFTFHTLKTTADAEESKSLNELDGPMVIISSSGMCETGRILHHLRNNLARPDTTVLIVGYMAEGTLGRRLAEGATSVIIFGETVRVNARVQVLSAFSAHADYQEMTAYLLGQTVRKAVYLVHGEGDAQTTLQSHLKVALGGPAVEIAKLGQTVEL